jgi:hypothetical protein
MPHITPPDVLNDLNAMHNIEKAKINYTNVLSYHCELLGVVVRDGGHDPKRRWPFSLCITSTAAQRAEAFCLTLEPEDK